MGGDIITNIIVLFLVVFLVMAAVGGVAAYLFVGELNQVREESTQSGEEALIQSLTAQPSRKKPVELSDDLIKSLTVPGQ